MAADSILCLRIQTNSMAMKFDELIERQNFIYWYSTAVEEDLRAAKSLHEETFNRLMAKYAGGIKIIDILVHGKLKNVR